MSDLDAVVQNVSSEATTDTQEATPQEAVAAEVPVTEEVEKETAEKKQAEERVAARFAALAREEKRVRMEREAIRREKAEAESIKVKWAPVESGDPVAFRERLAEKGIDAEEWVRRFLNEGKPTTESKLDALERKVAEYEARIAKQAEEEQKRQESTQVEAAKESFLGYIETNAEKYPLLYEYTPDEIKQAGWFMVQQLIDEGGEPTQDDIAASLETRLQAVAKERESRRAKLQARKAPAAAPTEEAKVGAKTLTNAVATEKATAGRVRTQAEIDAECVKLIQSSFR